MRILVVEDSPRLQRAISGALRRSNFAVDVADDGEAALWLAGTHAYDLIVLDIMLPKKDGLAVLGELRRGGSQVHVLILTARDTVADRVHGLRAGADDYLVKPFSLDEFLARVVALCRRAYGTKRPVQQIGDLEIDTTGRIVRRGGKPVDLTAREYLLLEYLACRRGQVVTRTQIEEHIYDSSIELMSNAVDSAICSLRKKLGGGNARQLVHTRRGLGYVLEEQPDGVAGR